MKMIIIFKVPEAPERALKRGYDTKSRLLMLMRLWVRMLVSLFCDARMVSRDVCLLVCPR
jgi:hypothetical protein